MPKRLIGYTTAKRKPSPKPPKRVKRRHKTAGGRNSDPKKLAWQRAETICIVTQSPYGPNPCAGVLEVHHDRPKGSRATDRRTATLCTGHHRTGPCSVQMMGRTRFQRFHGLDMDYWTAKIEYDWQASKRQAHQARGGA